MSIDQTIQERGKRYGDFSDHARICQAIQKAMHDADRPSPVVGNDSRVKSWDLLSDVQRQALTVIADKIARILSGDPNYADNWHDIQGYAKLAEERLPKEPADLFEDEPANQMEDDSQRMAAIGQNGNTGEHYAKEILVFTVDDILICNALEGLQRDRPISYKGKSWEVLQVLYTSEQGARAKIALREKMEAAK